MQNHLHTVRIIYFGSCFFYFIIFLTAVPVELSCTLVMFSFAHGTFKYNISFALSIQSLTVHGWCWLLFCCRRVKIYQWILPVHYLHRNIYKQKKALASDSSDPVLLVILILTYSIRLDKSFWLSRLYFRLPLSMSRWKSLHLSIFYSEHFTQILILVGASKPTDMLTAKLHYSPQIPITIYLKYGKILCLQSIKELDLWIFSKEDFSRTTWRKD